MSIHEDGTIEWANPEQAIDVFFSVIALARADLETAADDAEREHCAKTIALLQTWLKAAISQPVA